MKTLKTPKTPYLYELLAAFSKEDTDRLIAELQTVERDEDCFCLLGIILEKIIPLRTSNPSKSKGISDLELIKLCGPLTSWSTQRVATIRHRIFKVVLRLLGDGCPEENFLAFQIIVLGKLLSYRALLTFKHVANPVRKWVEVHPSSPDRYLVQLKLAEYDLEYAILTSSRSKCVDFNPVIKTLECYYLFHWLKWQSFITHQNRSEGIQGIVGNCLLDEHQIEELVIDDPFLKRMREVNLGTFSNARVAKECVEGNEDAHLNAENVTPNALVQFFEYVDGLGDFPDKSARSSLGQAYMKPLDLYMHRFAHLLSDDHPEEGALFLQEGALQYELKISFAEKRILSGLIQSPEEIMTRVMNLIGMLDRFYLYNFLKYRCAVVNQARILELESKEPEMAFLESQIKAFQSESHLIQILLSIYHLVAGKGFDERNFRKAKRLLDLSSSRIEPEERTDCYVQLINIAARALSAGDLQRIFDLRRLYKKGINKQYLLNKNGSLSPYHFKNMLNIACRAGDFGWVKKIHSTYLKNVQFDFKDMMDTYATGLIAFFEKDFQKAISFFLKTLQSLAYKPNHDPFLGIDTRLYLVKSLYEADVDPKDFEKELASLRMLVRRTSKVAKRHASQLNEFCKILSRISSTGRPRLWRLERERESLCNNLLVTERNWLLEKIELLITKSKTVRK